MTLSNAATDYARGLCVHVCVGACVHTCLLRISGKRDPVPTPLLWWARGSTRMGTPGILSWCPEELEPMFNSQT